MAGASQRAGLLPSTAEGATVEQEDTQAVPTARLRPQNSSVLIPVPPEQSYLLTAGRDCRENFLQELLIGENVSF